MDDFKWRIDDFDSKIFNLKTAKVDFVNPNQVKKLIRSFEKQSIDYAVIRVNAKYFDVMHALEKEKFYIVDGFVEMECKINSKMTMDNKEIVKAKITDLPVLEDIASRNFKITRYFNDNFLPKSRSAIVYKKWIQNSVNKKNADEVLVFKDKKMIKGFITLTKDGHVPLIVVDEPFQGQGIAKKLLSKAFKKFSEWDVDIVRIETQLQNISSLRAYMTAGFKIKNTYMTFGWHGKNT